MSSAPQQRASFRSGLLLGTLACALVMAGCTSTRIPAPIVSRTSPGDSGRPPVMATTPAPAATTATTEAPATVEPTVTAEPIRSPGSGIEVRSLETRPLDSPPAAGAAGATRSLPRLVKRPYSDQALAEVNAADASSGYTPPPVPSTAVPGSATAPVTAPSTAEAAKAGSGNFDWPARGRIVQPFADPRSLGIVIDGVIGDPVSAAADGRVIFSGNGPRGYGNLLIIKHDDDTVSVYGHNKSLLVKEGQTVKRGQKVAELGDSSADRPGLLFEVRKQGKPVDPLQFLPKR